MKRHQNRSSNVKYSVHKYLVDSFPGVLFSTFSLIPVRNRWVLSWASASVVAVNTCGLSLLSALLISCLSRVNCSYLFIYYLKTNSKGGLILVGGIFTIQCHCESFQTNPILWITGFISFLFLISGIGSQSSPWLCLWVSVYLVNKPCHLCKDVCK